MTMTDYSVVFDANPDAIFILDSNGQILNANLSAVQRYGYSLEELKQMNAADLAAQDMRDQVQPHLQQSLKSGDAFEWRHRCKDGSELPVEIFSRSVIHLGKQAILSSVRDISQRKKLETKLQEKQHFLEQVLNTEPGTVYIYDLLEHRNIYINRHWLSVFGYTPEETQAMGSEVLRLFHPDDLSSISANHEAQRDAADGEISLIEYRVRDKDGTWHWLLSRETPFTRDEGGKVSQILGIASDITERKLIEESLRQSEELFSKIFHAGPAGRTITRVADGKFIEVNESFLNMFECSREETIGHTSTDLNMLTPEERDKLIRRQIESGGLHNAELLARAKSGRLLNLLFSSKPMKVDGEDCLVTTLIDITERKQAEALLDMQRDVLEMIATGASLPETLTELTRNVEVQSPGMLTSILLLDEDGVHVRHGAAPSLPPEFVAAIEGQPIGPDAGSCGTAAYRKEAVYVEDIATDPRWANYKAVALRNGLRACWSTPVFDAQQRVLGTFAMYFRQPGLPQAEHLHLIGIATHIASIAISNRRESEALRDAHDRLQLAFATANQAWFDVRVQTGEVHFSSEYARMLGFDPEGFETSMQNWIANLHPDDHDAVLAAFQACLVSGGPSIMEYRRRTKSGDWIWLHSIGKVVEWDDAHKPARMVGIHMDITGRKQAEAALWESNDKLRLFIEHAPAAIAMFDRDMRYIAHSQRWLADYGLAVQELVGRSHYEIFPDLPERWKEVHQRCLTGAVEKCDEDPFPRANGSVDWVRWEAHPWRASNGDIGGLIIFSEVITARKQAEQAIQESEAAFRMLFESSRDAILTLNIEEGFKTANPAAVALFGCRDERELIALSPARVSPEFQPDGRKSNEKAQEMMRLALDKGSNFFEWMHRRMDGTEFMTDVLLTRMEYGGKELLQTTVRDITDRKQAEAELRKLSLAVEQSPNSIVITNLEPNIEYVNNTFLKLTGYRRDEVIGKNPRILQSGKTPKATYEDMWAHLTRGETWHGELLNKRKDGSEYIERANLSPVRQADGRITHYLAIKENITEAKKAEERIESLAHFDQLTGLPNRILLSDRFKYSLSLAQRSGKPLAVMFLDLDHFKNVNDTLGHTHGKFVLPKMIKR